MRSSSSTTGAPKRAQVVVGALIPWTRARRGSATEEQSQRRLAARMVLINMCTMHRFHSRGRRHFASTKPLVGIAAIALIAAACGSSSSGGQPAASSPSAAASSLSIPAMVPAKYRSGGITLALDASFPPLSSVASDGSVVGLYVDMANDMAKLMGVKMNIVNASFNSLIPGIQAGKYDMSSFDDTKVRENVLDFVDYFQSGSTILVKQGNPEGLTANTLCGKRVAEEAGSVEATQVSPMLQTKCQQSGKPKFSIQAFPGASGAVLALTSGRADAVLADQSTLGYTAEQSNGALEVPNEPQIDPVPVGFGYTKDAGLDTAMIAALKVMIADGSYTQILAKWGQSQTAIATPVMNGAVS